MRTIDRLMPEVIASLAATGLDVSLTADVKACAERAARAERHLAYLEDFAARHGLPEGEGLIEFYGRKHYAQGSEDGRKVHYGVMMEAYQRTRVRGYLCGTSNWCASMVREIAQLSGPPDRNKVQNPRPLRMAVRSWNMPELGEAP